MNFKNVRKSAGLTQQDVADYLKISRSAYTNLENGRRKADYETLNSLSELFRVSVDCLLGNYDVDTASIGYAVGETISFPILISVHAGFGNAASVEEYGSDIEVLPRSLLRGYKPEDCRVLLVRGDSMYPKICDGDRVLVHLQNSVDSGDIAVIVYNGNDATIKKVEYKSGENWLKLIPTNPEVPEKKISGPDLQQCHVIGKVIELLRSF